VSSRIDDLARTLLAVTALLESRNISQATRMHLERLYDELLTEVIVLKEDQENRLAA
jgi:hypothetical protein